MKSILKFLALQRGKFYFAKFSARLQTVLLCNFDPEHRIAMGFQEICRNFLHLDQFFQFVAPASACCFSQSTKLSVSLHDVVLWFLLFTQRSVNFQNRNNIISIIQMQIFQFRSLWVFFVCLPCIDQISRGTGHEFPFISFRSVDRKSRLDLLIFNLSNIKYLLVYSMLKRLDIFVKTS